MTYNAAWRAWQRQFLIDALIRNHGNQCATAGELDIHRNTLGRMCELQGINPEEFRKAKEPNDKPTVLPRFRRDRSELVGRREFRAHLREVHGPQAGAQFLDYPIRSTVNQERRTS